MKNASLSDVECDYPLTESQIESYRADGFIQLPDVFVGDELKRARDAIAGAVESETDKKHLEQSKATGTRAVYEQIFIQRVNLWTRHPDVRSIVLSPRLANLAARLEGVPMRIWHDHALFKEPGLGNNKTPWHQDSVYWPHQQRVHQTTIWIALKDATVANGCMSFVAGTHKLGPLPPIDLVNPQDIFKYAPQIKPVKPKVCELKAGSVTFHSGLTFHYAGPNKSDGMREAFAIIYMPDGTTYDGQPHCVTDPLNLKIGDRLDGDLFPLVST